MVKNPTSPFAEAFRTVRAGLLSSPDVQVVALTSALPNDGKTTCSIALARQCALDGYSTVLIDCDLRRGSSTLELGEPPQLGLLEVLEQRCTLDDALSTDRLTPLSFLPVVRDFEAIQRATLRDAFGAEEMARLISSLRERFDYVFIDTPPVLALVDARRLTPLVDKVLFLSCRGSTPGRAVKQAVDLLKAVEAPLAGLVLTDTGRGAAPSSTLRDRGASMLAFVARAAKAMLPTRTGNLRRSSGAPRKQLRRR